MSFKIQLGHKHLDGPTMPMPEALIISNENETQGFILEMSPAGELTVTKVARKGPPILRIQPKTASQITVS